LLSLSALLYLGSRTSWHFLRKRKGKERKGRERKGKKKKEKKKKKKTRKEHNILPPTRILQS